MLIAFFDSKSLIHKELLPESTTSNAVAYTEILNAVAYTEILKRLLQRIRHVRPEYAKQGFWTLLHNALVIWQFLAVNGVVTLDHPPYSPDLAPADFFLFPD
ncbi:histone-lysine N-methyltransferase SETMAR [Trichonephila clavipes]|nr:histone-lysine N-methyltransferase SETMAR [Trichonephila clavipes]